MWQFYRKTFLLMQAFILILLAVMHFYFKVSLVELIPYIVIMELFSVIGAAWSMRLRRKILSAKGDLPHKR
jgi:cobalamin synthase